MEIHYYNQGNTSMDPNAEVYNLYAYMLLCDHMKYDSVTSSMLLFQEEVEYTKHYKLLFMMFENWYPTEGGLKIAAILRANLDMHLKLSRMKIRGKNELVLIGRYNALLSQVRKMLKKVYDDWFIKNRLEVLPSFGLEASLILAMSFYVDDDNKESAILSEIVKTILEKKAIISLDATMESKFSFVDYHDFSNPKADFIKFHVCDLPPIIGLSFEQMKHIKSELKVALNDLTTQMNELQEKYNVIDFNKDNLKEVIDLGKQHIEPCLKPLKQAVEESLYLSKLRGEFSPDNILRFSLGVTSIETLVDFYEQSRVIEPYVASEMKQQISRNISLNSPILFCYLNYIPGKTKIDIYCVDYPKVEYPDDVTE